MITLKDIQDRYYMPIPKRIRDCVNSWIAQPEAQAYIVKALDYELTDQDCRELFRIGSHKAKYPRLYYLCCIYIHPLTVAQHIVTNY